jgi:hypothetical protein
MAWLVRFNVHVEIQRRNDSTTRERNVIHGEWRDATYGQISILRLAVANYERADAVENPKLKAKFMEIAARYRDLALEIDDAESRPGGLLRLQKLSTSRSRFVRGLRAFTCQLQLFRFLTHIVLVSAQEAGNFSE